MKPEQADIMADIEFRALTRRLPADAVEKFANACRDHLATRHLFTSNSQIEPRQSEIREALAIIANRFADLEAALLDFDKALGLRGALFQLADREKDASEQHGYSANQLATKARTGPAFLKHGEAFASWLAKNYTRRDGRQGWNQPNADGANERQSVRAFSSYAMECFGRAADAVVSRTATVLMGFEIEPDAVKKLRSKQGEKVSENI